MMLSFVFGKTLSKISIKLRFRINCPVMSHSSQSPMEQGELGSEREFGDSPGGIELDPESDQDSEASSSRDERDSGRRER